MEDWQPCSQILSHILKYMGHCTWIMNARKQFYSAVGKRSGVFISGSKGEGLSNLLQSDIDALIFHDDICGTIEKEGHDAIDTKDPTRYMFRVEREWSPPGYCMLVLASRPTQPITNDDIERSLWLLDKGVNCLHATNFFNCVAENIQITDKVKTQITGPSQPSIFAGLFEYDSVLTVSCSCSVELDGWYNRPRHYDWPSTSLQQDVISTTTNIVAVGSTDGIFSKMEWRFCFNRAELKLMDSLNLTQKKVYVVLKMILKDHLKPKNKEITSYIVKNIVFWMCETNPSFLFTPNTLLSWIYVGLQTLKGYIESGNLPYYMIPARNLLHGKFLDDATKLLYQEKLSKLLESGACLVHVCETIKLGLELYNEGLLEDYGWKRNLIEMYILHLKPLQICMKFELLRLAGNDAPEIDVLLPDFKTLKACGYTRNDISTVFFYRVGLFLDYEKAEDFAQFYVSN